MSSVNWFKYAAPREGYTLAGRLIRPFAALAALLALAGLHCGLLLAPTDAQQGEAYRIIFVHVPAAWLSMILYLAMAFWSALALVLRTRLSAMMAQALAPTGALFALLSLLTGMLWGKPMWGAWWVWDARLSSALLLLLLYLGYLSLISAFEEPARADRAGAMLALVGACNLPVLYFSVRWWNTLHQGSSVALDRAPTMAAPMLAGMLLLAAGGWCYAAAAALRRLRLIILEREQGADWVSRELTVLRGEK